MSLLLLGAGRSFAAEAPAPAAKPGAPAAAKAAPAKVEKSSAPAAALEPQTIAEVYNGLSVRDPFISVLGTNPRFHSPDDRWPYAVDLEKAAAIAAAFVEVAAQLAS